MARLLRSAYDQLVDFSRTFERESNSAKRSLDSLKRQIEVLEGGDWIGKGADAFCREMNSEVGGAVAGVVVARGTARLDSNRRSRRREGARPQDPGAAEAQGEGVRAWIPTVGPARCGASLPFQQDSRKRPHRSNAMKTGPFRLVVLAAVLISLRGQGKPASAQAGTTFIITDVDAGPFPTVTFQLRALALNNA